MTYEDKALGALLGLVCGDVIGTLTKTIPPDKMPEKMDHLQDISAMDPLASFITRGSPEKQMNQVQRAINHITLPGLYSLHAQQALIIMETLQLHQKIDLGYMAGIYLQWARYQTRNPLGLFRGEDQAFKKFLNRLLGFIPPHESGVHGFDMAAAAKIAPLGIYYAHNDMELIKAITECTIITHRDIRSIALAAVVAYTISCHVFNAPPIRNTSFLKALYRFIYEAELQISEHPMVYWSETTRHEVSEAIRTLADLLHSPSPETGIRMEPGKPTSNFRASASALESFMPIFSRFLVSGDGFAGALSDAVKEAENPAATGAMSGALYGASLGRDKIPSRWLNQIYHILPITNRAQALINKTGPVNGLGSLYELEKTLCSLQNDYRKKCRSRFEKFFPFKL